jgi:DNA polymerase-3 subunit alpha
MQTIPLFKSHYSIGKSILTLEKEETSTTTEADSIIDLALKHKLKDVVLVEDSMSGFLEAYTNCKAAKLNLIFGLRITVCNQITEKNDESLTKQAKYIIFVKNHNGYKRLIKIFTKGNLEGFYYEPRVDFNTLKENWSDEDLMLAIPFYDSFLFKNVLRFSTCTPDFSFAKPVFFLEDNDTMFDEIARKRVKEYCSINGYETVEAQTVYYAEKKDFPAYLTFRCINNRSTLSKPDLDHFTSDCFCLEQWLTKK